jgi:hypothetical protein
MCTCTLYVMDSSRSLCIRIPVPHRTPVCATSVRLCQFYTHQYIHIGLYHTLILDPDPPRKPERWPRSFPKSHSISHNNTASIYWSNITYYKDLYQLLVLYQVFTSHILYYLYDIKHICTLHVTTTTMYTPWIDRFSIHTKSSWYSTTVANVSVMKPRKHNSSKHCQMFA